jgi:transcriptional antiterminator RfaH
MKSAEADSLTIFLTPSEIRNDQPIGFWFCLRAQPKREHIAAACLRQISGVEVFSPRVHFRKYTNRGFVWFAESMFPGYFFARFNYAALNRRIRHGPAVTGFLQFGERLPLLPDALISEIRKFTNQNEVLEIDQALKPGVNVQITQGPLQGLEALVTRLITGSERVEILINWMGRSLHAKTSVAHLVPLPDD